jgi:hypothetical protein
MKHRAGHRVLELPLIVDRSAGVTLRLSRRGLTIKLRHFALHRGSNLLRLQLSKTLKRGLCQLSVRIAAGDQTRTLSSSVTIGP